MIYDIILVDVKTKQFDDINTICFPLGNHYLDSKSTLHKFHIVNLPLSIG